VFCLRSISTVRAHARDLRLHSRLRASPPCPLVLPSACSAFGQSPPFVPTPAIYVSTPDFVHHPRAPSVCRPLVLLLSSHQPSLIAPRSLAPTSPPLSSRNATAPPLPPSHDVLPLAMAPSAIAAQICLTHEGEDQIRSTMATRDKLRAMDLYEILLLTTRPARRASTSSIYRYGSGGTSLCSATRSSEGGRARGTPDRRGKHLPLLCPTLLPMPSAPPSSDLPQQRTPLLTMPRLASPTVKAASMSVAPFHSHARRELRRPRPSPPEPRSAPLPRPTPSAQLTPPRVIDPAPLAPHQSRQNPIAAAVNLAATSTCSKCRRRPTSSSRCDPPSLPRLL
jgi:hypothetical protein